MIQDVLERSDEFFYKFPTEKNRIKNYLLSGIPGNTTGSGNSTSSSKDKDKDREAKLRQNILHDKLVEHVRSAHVVVHCALYNILQNFVSYKKHRGTETEKKVYKDLKVDGLIERFIRKRPIVFYGESDTTVLRDGKLLPTATAEWMKVGTDAEGEIKLQDYMSYEEIMLSSYVFVFRKNFAAETQSYFTPINFLKPNCCIFFNILY